MSQYRLLALGDVVGEEAVMRLRRILPGLKREYEIDFTVANGENAAVGNGLDRASAKALFDSGIDVLTSGNHIFRKPEIQAYIEETPYLLRPANYPKGTPGKGAVVFDAFGTRVLVMNVLGTVYLDALDCPFRAVEEMLQAHAGQYDLSVLDIHAEATSEKLAIAHVFDGRISAIFGTHTHVQTADEIVLSGGTGYITDLGMCGPADSILGVSKERVITKLRTKMPVRFENPAGPTQLNGAVFTIDRQSKRAVKVERLQRILT